MSRTRPTHLLVLALTGALAAWLIELALVSGGRPVLVPPLTISVVLALIAVIVAAMAWPVRKVSRGVPGARVDPFYAARVVVLAKASSLTGAILGGAGIGILVHLSSRTVLPGVGSLLLAGAMALAAIMLIAGGLLAEHWCTIPPDDDENAGPETQGTT